MRREEMVAVLTRYSRGEATEVDVDHALAEWSATPPPLVAKSPRKAGIGRGGRRAGAGRKSRHPYRRWQELAEKGERTPAEQVELERITAALSSATWNPCDSPDDCRRVHSCVPPARHAIGYRLWKAECRERGRENSRIR